MRIGILSAMTKEHDQLLGLLQDIHHESEGVFSFDIGRLGENKLVLAQCGIGKVNAAVGASILIRRYQPACVISTGCAGGIDASLRVMDVVVSTYTAYHDVSIPGCETGQVQGLPARFRSEELLVETACALGGSDHHVRAGLICTGDQFISDHNQLAVIKEAFPEALAVDMESAAIAQTCFLCQVPFVSFRVLSDTPGSDGHIQQYLDFWDQMADRSFDTTRRFLQALPSELGVLHFAE